ncbi:exosortase A [Psychrosphaera haliotis]|uniref:Exosortase A n=1 Tax=Psychrosphaera haliotis TaxID=555083 RepID=A0A6N8FFD2_9GAMM|nr:exosortase A [Psychrosphaera haliotis]MUH73690.1 exosortase A [Psychrosphaera haliotis]
MDILNTLRTNKTMQRAIIESALLITFLVILYIETVADMVHLWLNSETYSHGLFIIPLTAVLIFARLNRNPIKNNTSQPLAALGILFFSACWLVSELAQINLLAQLSLMAIIPFVVWTLYGFKALWQLKSALLFLFLAVPAGDFLIPHLQQITAALSIAMIEFFGIPVYSDGLYISIPAGNFLVAEACSGIRFLISSITIAVFYALLYIDSYKRRVVMILSGVLVPILANGMRVFMIIVIAHLGNMEAATGFDHIVYGWVFFSFVMIMLIWLGNALCDQTSSQFNSPVTNQPLTNSPVTNKPRPLAYAVVAVALSIAPFTQYLITQAQPVVGQQSQNAGSAEGANAEKVQSINDLYKIGAGQNSASHWAVYFPTADNIQVAALPSNNKVTAYKVEYVTEGGDKELINFENRLFNPDRWSLKSQRKVPLTINRQTVTVQHTKIVNLGTKQRNILLVYKTGEFTSANQWQIKGHQVINKLLQTDFGGQALIISAEQTEVSEAQLLEYFSQFIQQEQ